MKARFIFSLFVMAVSLWIPQTAHADARQQLAQDGLVRLQVRAASDDVIDQEIKLYVRDAVRAQAVEFVQGADNPDEALSMLSAHRTELAEVAGHAARECGYGGGVRVEVGQMDFPLRIYGETIVPPGHYRALRVTLGDGSGRNWWCVVYPDLCATEPAGAKALENREPIRFYSSIMRWFRGLIQGRDAS